MRDTVNHFSPQSKTQSAAILRLLIEARGSWVPLPEILKCAAQYSARVCELRKLGFNIENRTERRPDGARHSWFRLVPRRAETQEPKPEPIPWEERRPVTGLELWDALK
jgi:hypothetical protein